uniref:Uncharacterized protein n=1 Tax=Timema cristinae TaxID=61476 RepID=A0A7R9HCM2_TIMCR|nr:unnamed protein product [Timema cristinae]
MNKISQNFHKTRENLGVGCGSAHVDTKVRSRFNEAGQVAMECLYESFKLTQRNVDQTDAISQKNSDVTSIIPSGFDLRQALGSHLLTYFRQKMDEERRLNIAGGLASAVLFIPPQGYSISDADLQASINSFQNFKLRVPDVKFFYLVTGNGARFNNLVEDHNRDILTLNTGLTALETTSSSLSQALSRVQRRIINSNCGSDWQHRSYTGAQFSDAIDPSTVNIYRLHANYFFSSTSGKIKVK